MRKFSFKRELFIVALVADFSSPKTAELLKSFSHKPVPPIQIALYPMKAEGSKDDLSTCGHILEKFIYLDKIPAFTKQVKPSTVATSQPLAGIFHKIAFDLEFGLHPINQVILNFNTQGRKDSCGEDFCKALTDLEKAVRQKNARLRIQTLSPISCPQLKSNFLNIENVTDASADKVVQTAIASSTEADAPAKVVAIKGPSQLRLSGPPLTVRLEKTGAPPVTITPPQAIHLDPGTWRMTVVSPSWLKTTQAMTVTVQNFDQTLDIKKAFGTHIIWVESSQENDLMAEFEETTGIPSVLIPKNSAPVPFVKNATFKVYKLE